MSNKPKRNRNSDRSEDRSKSQKTFPNKPSNGSLVDVAVGVKYYWRATVAIIINSLLLMMCSSKDEIMDLLGNDTTSTLNLLLIVGAVQLVLLVFIVPPMIKAMEAFSHTPDFIFPNAKGRIRNSWIWWGLGLVSLFCSGFNTSVALFGATILWGVSYILFATFLNQIGRCCFLSQNGCSTAITLLSVFYIASAINHLAPNVICSLLALIGGFGGIMYLSYLDKLKKYFSQPEFEKKENPENE